MKKDWKLFANHILDCIAKINKIKTLGDITQDSVLYDVCLIYCITIKLYNSS